MSTQNGFSASALIQAPARHIYDVVADYHDGHRRIIPSPPFVGLDVEQGGIGAGTVIRVQIRVLGRTQTYRATISEPEPGRVLLESNDTGWVTTFTVEPRDDGRHAHVTIATAPPPKSGIFAALERRLIRSLMLPVFARELQLLADVAKERVVAAGDAGP